MSKNAASEEILGQLHQKVANAMIGVITRVEKGQEEYDRDTPMDSLRPELSPAMLSAMTKFLADNSITANPAEDVATSELEKRLAAKRTRKMVGNVVPILRDE